MVKFIHHLGGIFRNIRKSVSESRGNPKFWSKKGGKVAIKIDKTNTSASSSSMEISSSTNNEKGTTEVVEDVEVPWRRHREKEHWALAISEFFVRQVFLDFRGRIKEHADVYLDRIDFSEKEKRKLAAGRRLKRVSITRDLTPPAKFSISIRLHQPNLQYYINNVGRSVT